MISRFPSVGSLIPQGLDYVSKTFSQILGYYSLNLVALIGRVVDNSVDLLAASRVDICQQPVATNISLDPPGKRELSVRGLDVHQTRLGLLQASAC